MQHEQTVMHNKIDQFTVGVIKGALFSEHNLYQNRITITLEVIDKQRQIDAKIKQALDLALEDLANGWLPLGASGSRGLGTFIKTNDTTWSDNKTWLNS